MISDAAATGPITVAAYKGIVSSFPNSTSISLAPRCVPVLPTRFRTTGNPAGTYHMPNAVAAIKPPDPMTIGATTGNNGCAAPGRLWNGEPCEPRPGLRFDNDPKPRHPHRKHHARAHAMVVVREAVTSSTGWPSEIDEDSAVKHVAAGRRLNRAEPESRRAGCGRRSGCRGILIQPFHPGGPP